MASTARAKGDRAEREIVGLLRDLTGWPVARAYGAGRSDDCGDLDGLPDCCAQVKDYGTHVARAVNDALTELPAQQAASGLPFAVGLVRRPRGRWVAVMEVEMFAALLREATG
jgi:hypothetical protein